jgi:branched-chain amino acid transport system permease protein
MRHSRIGRVLMAVRDNDRGVQSYGVNVVTAKLSAFAISGFLAAVAGVLLVHLQSALYPGSVDADSSKAVFLMAVIGGLGSIPGVFTGAIYVQGLSWARTSFPMALRPLVQLAGTGVGLIVVLMFLPGGIGSLLFTARDRLLRRLADRRGIIVPSLVADAAQPEQVSEDDLEAALDGQIVEVVPA